MLLSGFTPEVQLFCKPKHFHSVWPCRDAEKEQKKTKRAEDKWPALKVFNQACNAAEAACLHNAAVQLVVYGTVPRAADKKQAGLQAQVRGAFPAPKCEIL